MIGAAVSSWSCFDWLALEISLMISFSPIPCIGCTFRLHERKLNYHLFYFWIHISFSFSLVYINSTASTAAIFMEYLDVIKSLTNIDQIQIQRCRIYPSAPTQLGEIFWFLGMFWGNGWGKKIVVGGNF